MTQITPSEIYKEQYAHFRAMNDILYKIPPIFTAVLGGLWYFAASAADLWVAATVFLFAAVLSILFMGVMCRFRLAFNAYIKNLNKLDGDYAVSIKDKSLWPSTIKLVNIMLLTSALFSVVGAVYKLPVAIPLLGKTAPAAVTTQQPPTNSQQPKL